MELCEELLTNPTWSDAQIQQNAQLALQAASQGFTCHPTATGDQVLQYWELTLSIAEVVAILFGFYAFFHIVSFLALSALYRQKR